MIKAIIFDVGGVLIRTHDHAPRRNWEKKLGLAERELEQIVFNSEIGQKAQRGEITDGALWTWIGQHLNLSTADLTAFRSDFWAGDVLDTGLIAFIRSLRSAYQTAIISNATDALHDSLTHQHKIADAFDVIVGSAREKVMKPDPAIYQRTLQRLGRLPQEAVFIDDFAHNIEAARALGWHTIHFRPDTNVPAALAKLGVVPLEEVGLT